MSPQKEEPSMLIRRSRPEDCARILPSEITPPSVYLNRRTLLQSMFAAGAMTFADLLPSSAQAAQKLNFTRDTRFSTTDKPNSYQDITTYNNYYEFGTDKSDPSELAGSFKPTPWSIKVSGEAEVKGTFTLEDILKPHPLEERIYRFRCVEAWSMVIPWVGFPLADLIKRFSPTSRAKYVEFTTLYDTTQMPYERTSILPWPYVEGLRMDEAVNPLTLMVVGLYGSVLPNQDGAPLRLIVPWKYGFK